MDMNPPQEPTFKKGESYLLFMELASVSFKASFIPKDKNNIIMQEQVDKPKRLRNLLGLAAYTGEPLDPYLKEIEKWFREVHEWATRAALPTNEVLVIGTAVLRDLQYINPSFVKKIKELVFTIFGAEINILDGFIEAQLLTTASRPSLHPDETKILFDLGGGSLEIVCLEPDSTHFTSLYLGAGKITAKILAGEQLSSIMEKIKEEFSKKCGTISQLSQAVWFGTGGAVKAFLEVFTPSEERPINCSEIQQEFKSFTTKVFGPDGRLIDVMRIKNFEGLNESAPFSLKPHRRKIYPGGLLVVQCLCEYFKIQTIRLDRTNIRSGLLRLLEILRQTPFPK